MGQLDGKRLVLRIIGQNIGRLRYARGMSQSSLALDVGVDRSHLCEVENGGGNVSVVFLAKLADGLGVPITALFEGLDECSPAELAMKRQERRMEDERGVRMRRKR